MGPYANVQQRDLGYALLEKESETTPIDPITEQLPFRSSLSGHDSVHIRRAAEDQYTDIPGIPQPSIWLGYASPISYSLAWVLVGLIVLGAYFDIGDYGSIPLGDGLDSIEVNISGCDIIFEKVAEGQIPHLHFRTWHFMGTADYELGDKSVRLNLHNMYRNPIFHCNAVFHLLPGTDMANTLKIYQHGEVVAIAAHRPDDEKPGDPPLVCVRDRAEFSFMFAQVTMFGLNVPEATFNLHNGFLDIHDPLVGKLSIHTAEAQVAVRTKKRHVNLKMDRGTLKNSVLYAGDFHNDDHQHQRSGDVQIQMAPPGKSGSLATIELDIHIINSVLKVLAGDPDIDALKTYEDQKPGFVNSEQTIRQMNKFIDESGSDPFVLTIRVNGPTLPHGVWNVMSTKAYLAMSADWLVLASAGTLMPRTHLAEMLPIGMGLKPHPATILGALHAYIPHILDDHFVAWVPSSAEDPVVLYEKAGTSFHARHVLVADVFMFLFSLALNITGSLMLAAIVGYFILQILMPYVAERNTELILEETASHRLGHALPLTGWHIRASAVQYDPSTGSMKYGILLRWKKRPNWEGVVYYKFVIQSQTKNARFSLTIPKQFIVGNEHNGAQVQFFIPQSGKFNDPKLRDFAGLNIGEQYKFQIVQKGYKMNDLEGSHWSDTVYVDSPESFADLPFNLARTLVGSSSAVSSWDIFCDRSLAVRENFSSVMLHGAYLEVHESVMSKMKEVLSEGGGIQLSLAWGMGEAEDFLRFDLSNGSFKRVGRRYRTVSPISLTVEKHSCEDETLCLKLHPLEGGPFMQVDFKFTELQTQWENQTDLHTEGGDDIGNPPSVLEVLGNRLTSRPQEYGIGQPWWCELDEKDNSSMLMMEQSQCKFGSWVAFGSNDQYNPGSRSRHWQQYPQTAYTAPTKQTGGRPLAASQKWPRAQIRGIYPNEVILQGSQKVLEFSDVIVVDGKQITHINLELRPTHGDRTNNFPKNITEEPVPVSRGAFIWHVKFTDDGDDDMNGHFIVVAHSNGKFVGASSAFVITRPMLIGEVEMGYGAFCRAYGLMMQAMDEEKLKAHGFKVIVSPLSVCEDVRACLPAERAAYKSRRLEFCSFPGSMVASARPLLFEGSTVFRVALRMVTTVEGLYWKKRRVAYHHDLMLKYGLAQTSKLVKALDMPNLEIFTTGLRTTMMYIFQISVFIVPPIGAFALLIIHQWLHNILCYRYHGVRSSRKYLTDWLFSPGHTEPLMEQSIFVQALTAALLFYIFFVFLALTYTNFLRTFFRKIDRIVLDVTSAVIGSVTFLTLVIIFMSTLWIALAAMIKPQAIMPVAVMGGSLVLTARTLFQTLAKMKDKVTDKVNEMVESLLRGMLDEYINSQPDLATYSIDNVNLDDLDPHKARFVYYLCEMGEECDTTLIEAEEGEAEVDATDQADLGQGESNLPPVIRRKLRLCYQHIVAKMPLPKGVQKSLSDPRQLARICIERRQDMLQELLGDDGEAVLHEALDRNLDTKLASSMMKVLKKDENSNINVLDHEVLAKDTVLFYDKELAEQILSTVHARLAGYLKNLKANFKRVFDDLDPQKSKSPTAKTTMDMVHEYDKSFKQLVEEHDVSPELYQHEVDATGDGIATCKLLPLLQVMGFFPSFDQVARTSFTDKDIIENLLVFTSVQAKKATGGSITVMHRHHILAMVLQMVDTAGDGRVDNIWWDAWVSICQDLYILAGRDANDTYSYPVSLADLGATWMLETCGKMDTQPLLMVHRIEDVVLGKLLNRGGKKKLWREAFVMLCRHLHIWPEIPLDDANIEIVHGPLGSEVFNIVGSLDPPEYSKELGGIVKNSKPVHANPVQMGVTTVYTDEKDLVFSSMGDFSPDKGFTYFRPARKDLVEPSDKKWVHLAWDADAKAKLDCPPFTGPLTVFLIFLNVDADVGTSKRPWLDEEEWFHVDGKRLPTVKKLQASAADESEAPSLLHGFPSDRLRQSHGKTVTQVYMKQFGSLGTEDVKIELKGLNCGGMSKNLPDPAFVFLQAQRTQMPDTQSFDHAHTAFFVRSRLFKNLWDLYDKNEQLRMLEDDDGSDGTPRMREDDGNAADARFQKTLENVKGTSMIDLTPDATDLITDIFLSPYAMCDNPKPAAKNPNLVEVEPEKLRSPLERRDRLTGQRITVWMQPLEHDFFVEDMAFVELDHVEYKDYKFAATCVRSGRQGNNLQTSVATLVLIYKGFLIRKIDEPRPESDGSIVLSFDKITPIDQMNFRTKGGTQDPCCWVISGRVSSTSPWVQLSSRFHKYPLDPKAELVQIGKKQDGAIWHRRGFEWHRLRGIWFDAFFELLQTLDLHIDRGAAWSLWRVILSWKHEPVARQDVPGFITLADLKKGLRELMESEAFLSDDLFSMWNREALLGLRDQPAKKVYSAICAHTPDFHGAPNLVRWDDLKPRLHNLVTRAKPYLEKRSATGKVLSANKQYIVGSIWFEVLYDIVISTMPERYSRDEVREYYDQYANTDTGLLPIDRVYDVISKLGRPGLKFAEFAQFIRNLGMNTDDATLRLAFNRVDIDQNFTLEVVDVECGVKMLLWRVLPKQVLQKAGLTVEHIVRHVLFWLLVLSVMFFFLLISFSSLVSGKGNAALSGIQSGIAAIAGLGVTREGGSGSDLAEADDLVTKSIETQLGSSVRVAKNNDK